jgi:transposase
MSRKPRKQYSAQEKVAILRERLLEGKPLSEVCECHDLQPTVFYAWQKQFFENGAAAFQKPGRRQVDRRDEKIEKLEAKLTQKNEVLAELMQEHVQLKKELGEL